MECCVLFSLLHVHTHQVFPASVERAERHVLYLLQLRGQKNPHSDQ